MIKYAKLSAREIRDVLNSMGEVRNALAPDSLLAVELNYETALDALQSLFDKPKKHKPSEDGPKIRKELVFWEINPDTLPASVPQSVRNQIPVLLIH